MKKCEKLLNSAVYEIVHANEENYLLCRKNHFALFDGKHKHKDSIFSLNYISNAANVFYNLQNNQVLLVNTSGRAILYDLHTQEEINRFSLGHEMFGTGVSSDSQNFYYIDKNEKVIKVGKKDEKNTIVFEDESGVEDILWKNEKCYLFMRELKNNTNSNQYTIKCYDKSVLEKVTIVQNIDFISRRTFDFDGATTIFLVEEPTEQKGWKVQRSIYFFDEENMKLVRLYAIPNCNEWEVCYGIATYLQENLLAYASGDRVYVVDLKTGEVIDKIDGKYFCSVIFLNRTELLVGSWEGLFLVELD